MNVLSQDLLHKLFMIINILERESLVSRRDVTLESTFPLSSCLLFLARHRQTNYETVFHHCRPQIFNFPRENSISQLFLKRHCEKHR